jgi:uncharacterized membrane protein
MDAYRWALFAHLVGVVLFFSGMAVAGVAHGAAMRRRRPSEVALLLGVTRAGVVLVGLGSVLILVFGLWLVHLGGWGYGRGWIVAALCLFVLAALLGSFGGRRPKEARVLAVRLSGGEDAPSAELTRLVADRASLALNTAALVAALTVLALMVFKPGG